MVDKEFSIHCLPFKLFTTYEKNQDENRSDTTFYLYDMTDIFIDISL